MLLARRGDLAGAVSAAAIAVAANPDDPGLRLLMGLLHSRQLDLEKALAHFRRAAELVPADPLPRIELARALIGLDRLEEASDLIDRTGAGGAAAVELQKLRALLHRRRGEHGAAAALLDAITARDGRDFESWDQLGACRLAMGQAARAVPAFERALALRPTLPGLWARLVDAQVAAGQADTALAAAHAKAGAEPANVVNRLMIAKLEDMRGQPEKAEAALNEALAAAPESGPALLTLGDLLERSNRIDELEALLDRIDRAGILPAQSGLLHARCSYRRGRLQEALAFAGTATEPADAGARAQLIGQISDRLDDPQAAFDAFDAMNRQTAREVADVAETARRYRHRIADDIATQTPAWYARWPAPAPASSRRTPVFLVGFPRSGTTLLDTLLMGHPDTVVLEERPFLHAATAGMGLPDRLPDLDAAEIATARDRYFAEVDAQVPGIGNRLIVDKSPLNSINAPIVHRLFPDARFVFVQRHPCDVVLSCFMTRFQPTGPGANFVDLRDTALLYDLVLDHWRRCRAIVLLTAHTVRYERLVEDAEAQLRPLLSFLGLAWQPALLDHRVTARDRGYINSPSYAQVAEPLYTRARGRWRRYRAQLDPILPILAPWIDRLGYEP